MKTGRQWSQLNSMSSLDTLPQDYGVLSKRDILVAGKEVWCAGTELELKEGLTEFSVRRKSWCASFRREERERKGKQR